jgi:hypothetical protein
LNATAPQSTPKRVAKPTTASLVVTGLGCGGAAITAVLAWGAAAYGAWQTAIPPEVPGALPIQQAREQYFHGMTIFKISGTMAVLLAFVLAYLFWRRFASRADDRTASHAD